MMIDTQPAAEPQGGQRRAPQIGLARLAHLIADLG
jgi:hypothetical protein